MQDPTYKQGPCRALPTSRAHAGRAQAGRTHAGRAHAGPMHMQELTSKQGPGTAHTWCIHKADLPAGTAAGYSVVGACREPSDSLIGNRSRVVGVCCKP